MIAGPTRAGVGRQWDKLYLFKSVSHLTNSSYGLRAYMRQYGRLGATGGQVD